MKKFRLVILMSIISATILLVVSFWVPEFEGAFLGFVILAGCSLVWIQKENITHKFLSKLIIGSVIFGFLTCFLIFLRMYTFSHLIYDAPLPFKELWDKDYIIIGAVIMIVSFVGGLVGIVLKGFYILYKDKLNKIIILIGPLLALFSSLAVCKIKLGGTIMSSLHGWPYPFWIHQIKDIVDGFFIDKWIFLPGSLYHYVILNYILYLVVFILFFYLIKYINRRFEKRNINSTFFLFGLLVVMIIILTSFMSVKKSYINHQISGAKYCEKQSDCTIIGNVSPFSCAIVTNKDNADRILRLVKSYPSTGGLNCSGKERATCMQNKCRVSIDHTSNETYWDMLKKAVEDCRVESVVQIHDLEVTIELKNGKIIKAKGSEIDDIFKVVSKYRDKCGGIIMVTEELASKFESAIPDIDIKFQEESFLWWNDEDGYSILVPGIESIEISKDDGAGADNFTESSFVRDLLEITDQVMEAREFSLDEKNTSADETDRQFYDYVQAYKNGDELCVVRVNPDYGSYGCTDDMFMCNTVEIICGNDLAGSQAEQRPFLEALDLQDKETIVQIRKQIGDYFQVSIGHRRTGSTGVVKKEESGLRLLYMSQEDPFCEMVEKENIPNNVFEGFGIKGCWTEDGYKKFTESYLKTYLNE